ncbi:MAG TPA: EAL domain-containing protein [Tepidisphaeraceae bacterium]|nr:EAL domain-containing protein [Tepidisphaeraceae bacterium]
MHKLLARQLRRCFGSSDAVPADVQPLAQLVDESYEAFDADRALGERSIAIASTELTEQNEQLQRNNKALQVAHDQLRQQTIIAETLFQLGQIIAAELDLQKILSSVTQEATKLLRAQTGAFFYNVIDGEGQKQMQPVVCGISREQFSQIELSRLTTIFAAAFENEGIIRIADITSDPRYAELVSIAGASDISPTPRSLLAAPVVSRTGEVLGALFFAHEKVNVFGEWDERLLRGIAAHAAIALDNARLYQAAQDAGARLAHQAQHDALTGLPNRVLFRDRVQRCIERAKRRSDYHFAVLFLDLDRFKVVNDSIGHAAGDQLLMIVADRLKKCLRAADSISQIGVDFTVARMGGDEFTILLDDLTNREDANLVAERIIESLGQPYSIAGHEALISASVGIAHSDPSNDSPDTLLRDADAAMYTAKSGGRARFAVFSAATHDSALARLRIETDLRRALERDELRLFYQPIVCLEDRRIAGFEALLRWERDGKLIGPAEFIPIAEDTGLIVPIGTWVLREAVRQLQTWQRRHPQLSDLTISVNLSRRQLLDPKLLDEVRDVFSKSGLDPNLVKLEITESMLMQETQESIKTLNALREIGVGLQMDDFGTGYSSLSCLHMFPLDGLKIDRSFINNIAGRRDCVAVLQAIMTLAHNLNIKVVAEGLEQPEQVVLLQALECDYGQGYYFAKPLKPELAEQFALMPPVLAKSA